MAWSIGGLEDPSSDEFSNNPDFRQVAAFFLGWVFLCSVQIVLSSPLLQEILTTACSSFLSFITEPIERHRHEPNDVEGRIPTLPATTLRHEKTSKDSAEFSNSPTTSQLRAREGNALLVALALCFTCASVAQFVSLLGYTSASETACAFVVAWGGTTAQVGRLTGLLILSLELKRFAVRRREVYIFWVSLFVLLGLVFTNNAISRGTLRPAPQLGISLCYRKHFTPTGLASSLALISAELYLIIRFTFFVSPRGLGWLNKLDFLGDSRVYRALSLLLLDALTITSAVKPTNLLVDFVPFAVGAVVVLFAFDLGSPKKEATPSAWSYYNETRRFTLYSTPARSTGSTLSIRRMSNHTTHTISLPSHELSEHVPPPAPTRPTLSMHTTLRNFTTQEQQNSWAVINGHTKQKADSPPPSPETALPRIYTRSSVLGVPPKRSEHSETHSIQLSPRKSYKPQVGLIIINPDEKVPDVLQPPESAVIPDPGVYATNFVRMPPKHNNRARGFSASSELTYLSPISQKNVPARRPSYLLSPSMSHQSMMSTPHTPIPTWEDMYRQQGPQFDSRFEIRPLPGQDDSLVYHSPHAPSVPFVPFIARLPPPGLTKLQPTVRSSLLADTPPVERTSGIRGPRPLVTTPRSRVGSLRDGV